MIRSYLIKFESWMKCADSTPPLISQRCTHTHANSRIWSWSSICNLFNITSFYLHVAVLEEKAAVLKLFNRSHKSSITWQNSAARPPEYEMFTQRISGFSDSRFLCSRLVESEDVITLREITLLKHKSWIEQRIRCRQKCRYCKDTCFSFGGRTQSNSKRGEMKSRTAAK